MKNLPPLTLSGVSYIKKNSEEGSLVNKYVPFKNLLDSNNKIIDFNTTNLNFTKNSPVNIEIQPSFDGSVNLILNNDNEKPKLINSRFSVQEGDTFIIPDHKGNKDSNLYQNDILDLDTRLYKTINSIPKLEFKGLLNGGKMLCGSYHFYFRLSDNDGNETDIISESGLVTCHIGNINDPKSIRMGMENEDSKKAISFLLSNLDTSYDFIKVYYSRVTSDKTQQDRITYHYIDEKFSIIQNYANILITGFENIEDVTLEDINPLYEISDSVKAQAQCQNLLFFGNINKPNVEYEELADLSLYFIAEPSQESNSVGYLDSNYNDVSGQYSFEYYNADNIYNKLGYWPEEYYRLGVVYLLNDYTLSPVFNIRGFDFSENTEPKQFDPFINSDTNDWKSNRKYINIKENGFLEEGGLYENARGVIKIGRKNIIKNTRVTPISLKISIQNNNKVVDILKKFTKGFFIVRQERIPTILAQGVSIGKTKDDYGNIPIIKNKNSYYTQSFLDRNDFNKIGKSDIILETNYEGKASIVPEATIRNQIFNQIFTSSDFKLSLVNSSKTKYTKENNKNFYLDYTSSPYIYNLNKHEIIESKLTLVNSGTTLTSDGINYFSARAGDENVAWKTVDVLNKWNESNRTSAEINNKLSTSIGLVRGIFGTYVGLSSELEFGTIFNIRSNDYSEDTTYNNNMFKIRMESSEPYIAISDRLAYSDFNNNLHTYRGDCYVCNYTQRMITNFIDPDLPTNNTIVDKDTWIKNYCVKSDSVTNSIANNRILMSFQRDNDANPGKYPLDINIDLTKIQEPSDDNPNIIKETFNNIFNSEIKPISGATKINRGDVNAVDLGHWFTVKVLSNVNLSMRDIDTSYSTEEAIHGYTRSFFPFSSLDTKRKLPESNIINGGANVTLSKRPNFLIPDIPFIKNKFDTRILYSDIHTTDAFKNGYRVFQKQHYRDYTKQYGAIIDIKEWYGNLFVTMEHGCLLIPVNERALAAEGAGGNAYINTSNVLPENPKVISDLYGTTWQESVVKTKTGIYGIDTVAKKIWQSDGQTLINISDLKVQKFLNDNINLKESDKIPEIGIKNVKSHYNKNKGDIMFTFYNGAKEWSLCYNENLKKFVTFYSWIPNYSANINNTFFTFNKNDINNSLSFISLSEEDDDYLILENNSNLLVSENATNSKIWKHGQSGIYDNQVGITATKWYDEQETFEFEFVITEAAGVQKIFDNLKLISNKTEPSSFEFEIVGEGYEWYDYKDIIVWISKNQNELSNLLGVDVETDILKRAYKYVLSKNQGELIALNLNFPKLFNKEDSYKMPKLPFIPRIRKNSGKYELNTTNTTLINDPLLNEDKVHTEQTGNDVKKYGRVKGNMMYLEDAWDIEIKPIVFNYAYINAQNVLTYIKMKETRIRDKYLKVRVKYSGENLAVIQAIKSTFTLSFA
jgi:hypothetical protein